MSVEIVVGEARQRLRLMPAATFHTCITSPPYFQLREYDHPDQIGLEDTPEAFVEALVEVFREVRRVLRDDGTLWLNLGDTYAGSRAGQNDQQTGNIGQAHSRAVRRGDRAMTVSRRRDDAMIPRSDLKVPGVKPKELIGIPWRVALALSADGWYLRDDVIWSKPNPMPESVTDRCTKAHEYFFMLTKNEDYYFDAVAIAEPAIYNAASGEQERGKGHYDGKWSEPDKGQRRDGSFKAIRETRNKRNVWTVATEGYSGAHFAVYPPKLIEPCVLASSPENCCSACGAPHVRVVERTAMVIRRSTRTHEKGKTRSSGKMLAPAQSITKGFQPSCDCAAGQSPGRILDCFGGAGTTGLVAERLGRDAVLIELNPKHAATAQRRLKANMLPVSGADETAGLDEGPLFAVAAA